MKKRLSFLIAVLLLLTSVCSQWVSADAVSNPPTRVINVVYDDSGSMIKSSGEMVDTWCQAKYAMEVFASMLGENDTMNVYVMSDYMSGDNASPKLVLDGSQGAESNVAKVHDMITKAQDTPFTSVRKAYSDLVAADADEKWLVVLTDGAFDEYLNEADGGKGSIDQYIGQKSDDINVMFFGMGPKAAEITEKTEKNIYFVKAASNEEILTKITGICTRVFNSHKLEVDLKDKKISFDVPMSQLIVFAQGQNVEIGGLKSDGGETIDSSGIVSVRYSEKAATNPSYQEALVATNLVGKVATYNGDFDPGDYTIDVSGMETLEVYYKPNVSIAAYLKNADGEEVTNIANLETGEYTIEFGFIRAGSNEVVNESKLLGKVDYSAVVTNNGTTHDKTYTSGDKIQLEEGDLRIEATANFLDYNSVSTTLDYTIYENKGINFSLENEPKYKVDTDGIHGDKITVKVLLNDVEFTEEQWESFEAPSITLGDRLPEEDAGFLAFLNFIRKFNTIDQVKVEKTDTPGILELTPVIEDGKPKMGTYVGREYTLKAYTQDGAAVWEGKMDGDILIKDERSFWEREPNTVIRLAITIGFIILLLGYTPFFKKRFPKSMKSGPAIQCKPVPFGKTMVTRGRFTKVTSSKWLPYVPERGSLLYVPSGAADAPRMSLKATGNNKMIITNTSAFEGKKHIAIDGVSVLPGTKKNLIKGSGMMIEVTTSNMRYTCMPNMEA